MERRQRHEHSEMFREITSARQEEIDRLEADLRKQMEQAVQDLVTRMEQGTFTFDTCVNLAKSSCAKLLPNSDQKVPTDWRGHVVSFLF